MQQQLQLKVGSWQLEFAVESEQLAVDYLLSERSPNYIRVYIIFLCLD